MSVKLYPEDERLIEQLRAAVIEKHTLSGHRANVRDAACEYVVAYTSYANVRQQDVAKKYNCSEVSLRNTAKRLMLVVGTTRTELTEWLKSPTDEIASINIIRA